MDTISGFINEHSEYKRCQVKDFIAFFKFRNNYERYTTDKLLEVYEKYMRSISKLTLITVNMRKYIRVLVAN